MVLQRFFRSVIKPKVDKEKAKTEFYGRLLDYLNSKNTTRGYTKFMKENPDFDRDTIDKITSAQKAIDFYPTPERCLDYDPIVDCINNSNHILEPTAGLGSMVHFIEKHKSAKAKVDVNELNQSFIPILKRFFPDSKVTQNNFLEVKNDNDYDLIICNPPFRIGSDKSAYYDFLFKCIYMLNTSKTSKKERCLIFICPPLIEKERTWKAGEFNGFDFIDIFKNRKLTFDRLNKLSNTLQGKKLNKKEYTEFLKGEEYEDMDMLIPYQSEWVDTCEGFGGTGAKADVYRFILL